LSATSNPPKRCCAACFDDRGLRKEIIPLRSTGKGKCSYCETENVDLVEPRLLAEYFELVIAIYQPDDNGKPLSELLREDWEMFSHPKMDGAHAKELLGDILDDGDIVRKNFVLSCLCRTEHLAEWEKFRKELMYENRYFPTSEIDLPRLEELLSRLILDDDEIPQKWYRARIQEDDVVFPADKMGAPPARVASHGRANPAGIPYLYLGSLPNTAIAELRPHTGERASVAEFTTPGGLKIVDLRHPRKLISPFLAVDEQEVALLRGDIEFLERLGEELTIPVLPQGAAIDYIPSQYVCEFIKKCGYHGVIYRSSVSEGINLALFDPTRATIGNISSFRVEKVSVVVQTS